MAFKAYKLYKFQGPFVRLRLLATDELVVASPKGAARQRRRERDREGRWPQRQSKRSHQLPVDVAVPVSVDDDDDDWLPETFRNIEETFRNFLYNTLDMLNTMGHARTHAHS